MIMPHWPFYSINNTLWILLWTYFCPPKIYMLKPYPPSVTAFRDRAFRKVRSNGVFRVGP